MSPASRILILKLGAVGDVILATPHIRCIVEAHPGARVTLLTAPEHAALVSGHTGLEVVSVARRGTSEMGRVIRWLHRQHFDRVYDLQGSVRSRIMTLVSGARERIGRGPRLVYTRAPYSARDTEHVFHELNRMLQTAGIEPAAPRAWLSGQEQAEERVAAWLSGHGLQHARLALLHAGSSRRWLSKRWEEQNFADLASTLEGRGLSVLWIGGEAESELNQRLAGTAGVDATGVFSLTELAALGRLAVFAVVNDSGPMHLLAAAPLPVYAFFGPTDWRRSHALGQESRVLKNPVPCSPCMLTVCPAEKHHQCLREITPAIVLARLEADGLI